MSNRLGTEKSPYLLQHKDNPIHWYPWGEAAFQVAREQQKPVFLSIGYSTCHWCHVMAHETFEDAEVAAQINADFICIKVDREERPDVDSLYMKAVQAMTGGGGWPLSAWLTPEGKPFFTGTYFPKYRFQQLLRRVTEIWTTQRADLERDCAQMMKAITTLDEPAGQTATEDSDGARDAFLAAYINHFQYVFDEEYGGFGQAPKFPQTMNLMLMMRQDYKSDLKHAEVIVTSTLQNMLRGGMYDHLRGGFHRYSVDRQWLVPHFEKMLYDQALISVTLLEAFKIYGEPEFERTVRETLDYVLSAMSDPGGGFYAAEDADSLDPATKHMEEGYFATFSYDELKAKLTSLELQALSEVYGVVEKGQFEGRNILHLQSSFGGGAAKARAEVQSALGKLAQLRAARPRPHLDDKVITAWNAWMIWALAKAGRYLQEPRYETAALRAFEFLRTNLWRDGKLARFWRQGEARSHATAEDYASVIHAGLELALPEAGVSAWLLELQTILDRDFWDEKNGGYFSGDGRDHLLPLRTKDEYDGVTPGANSLAAFNLSRLYALTGEPAYNDKAERLFAWLFPRLKQFPSGLPFLGLAMDFARSHPRVVVASGAAWAHALARERRAQFQPYELWVESTSGWPVARQKEAEGLYICKLGACLRPATTLADARQQLHDLRPLARPLARAGLADGGNSTR